VVECKIEVVVDVRSSPYSRFAPHFNTDPLGTSLRAAGLKYVFLGRELGGRPDGTFYDHEGHVLYGRVARSPLFNEGLERLQRGLRAHRVAVMCAEEDPTDCHRRLLVARVLLDRGVVVRHVRGDGRVQDEAELGGFPQGELFNGFEESAWRSTRSVSRGRALLSSSGS
jgi:uncharacterized protein (DUF488 family)